MAEKKVLQTENLEHTAMSDNDLQDLVVESDSGARAPKGLAFKIMIGVALFWSVFQLWIASPLPFLMAELTFLKTIGIDPGFLVINGTLARYIHLSIALFIAFLAYPAFRFSPRRYIPIFDWLLAILAASCVLYLLFNYQALSLRSGDATMWDKIVAITGILLLLEATRRALGPPLMIISATLLLYTYYGNADIVPDMIRHAGHSLEKISNHIWITSEGVFGIALGVSTSFVFLFVLFGALLDKAGAGNYFIQVAFSLLGHFRGGPAKAAVLASGLTGLVSGSSIANVVTTGTFTIPLMRKVGFTKEKAGAVEVAASVNGQIMPPVMGAAAFLIAEYVGIPYTEVVKHAFLPAIISYIALLYIVHLEAVKCDMKVLPRRNSNPLMMSLMSAAITVTSIVIISGVVYYAVGWVKTLFESYASYVMAAVIFGIYVLLMRYQSRYPTLVVDDDDKEITELPETGPTVKSGLHYLLPIIVLVWCLMVERLSPGLSAFWATVLVMFILLTQGIMRSWFFTGDTKSNKELFKIGWNNLYEGLVNGARNMVGIGVATAAAGIVVGAVSLTGVGQVLTEVIEYLSGGSMFLVLVYTAIVCLILGMGLPTTANYIVVASLMSHVIVELGAQNGLIVPLIAVHLFVFYFGIMADITPPVGLASFAAAAVSGGDPIKTGLTAFFYSIRTVILPFLFIYNTDLLLINVTSFSAGLFIFVISTVAILLFAASTQGYFIARNKIYESILLSLIAFTLFVPGFWMDKIVPPFKMIKATQLEEILDNADVGASVRIYVLGKDAEENDKDLTLTLHKKENITASEIISDFGLTLSQKNGRILIEDVMFNSPAEKAGVNIELTYDLDFMYEIRNVGVEQSQPPKELMYIPALILLGLIIVMQRRRLHNIRIS